MRRTQKEQHYGARKTHLPDINPSARAQTRRSYNRLLPVGTTPQLAPALARKFANEVAMCARGRAWEKGIDKDENDDVTGTAPSCLPFRFPEKL